MAEFKQTRYYEEGSGPVDSLTMRSARVPRESRQHLAAEALVPRRTGWPMSVPLWYHWDGDAFFVVGRKTFEVGRSCLKSDDRCAICIEEMAHPRIRKVIAQCRAEIVEGPARGEGSQWVPVANAMALRYSGPTGRSSSRRRTDGSGISSSSSRTKKLTTWQGADWSPALLRSRAAPRPRGQGRRSRRVAVTACRSIEARTIAVRRSDPLSSSTRPRPYRRAVRLEVGRTELRHACTHH